MNINKKLKLNAKENKNNKEYQKIHKQLQKDLYALLDDSDYEKSLYNPNKLISDKENYNEEISDFMTKTLQPYFKSFKQWTEDDKIDKTTNKIENYFHVTYPKADKRKERTIHGVITRHKLNMNDYIQIGIYI